MVDFSLYLVTDRHQTRGRPLTEMVEACLKSGVRGVQLREKDLLIKELFAMGLELRGLTHQHGAKLLINDRVDVALGVRADGVHLPQEGIPPSAVRKLVGPDLLIGASTHSLAEARDAETEGADFVVLGPVFETPSKLRYGPPVGIEALRQVARELSIPVFAIGGIDAGRVPEVLGAGAHGVAVISALLAADDPGTAARALLAALERES